MHTIEDILGMIATEDLEEAFQARTANPHYGRKKEDNTKPLSFRYNLELVRKSDGSVYWSNYKEEEKCADKEEYKPKK